MGGNIARVGEMHTDYLSEHLRDATTLKPRHRWKYNSEMDSKKTGYEGVDSIYLARCSLHWQGFMGS
jgi:hypothetical protein